MPKIKVNDAHFYYKLQGEGQPVIFISGYTKDHKTSAAFLDQFAKKFQILTFDNRGVGQTEDDGRPLSAELMAGDVMALAKELHLEKPHIVGTSMGGTIAQNIGSCYGDRISKLILHVTSPKWRRAMLNGLETLLYLREKGLSFDEIFNASLPWIYGENLLQDEKRIQEVKKFILDNPFPQSLENQKRQFEVLRHFDGHKGLSSIRSPTLISHSKEDLLVLSYEARLMKDKIPHAEIHVWEGGHDVFFDCPEHLGERFVKFFQSS